MCVNCFVKFSQLATGLVKGVSCRHIHSVAVSTSDIRPDSWLDFSSINSDSLRSTNFPKGIVVGLGG